MSGFESNCAGGGYKNDFESIIKGAGLEGGVVPPELYVPERCSNCPTLRRLQAELFNAASKITAVGKSAYGGTSTLGCGC